MLGSTLPDKPQVVFRGVTLVKELVAPSVCDPYSVNKPMFFQNLVGYYRCKTCAVCSINAIKDKKITHFSSLGTSLKFPVKSFVTCFTPGVVHLLTSPWGFSVCGTYGSTFYRSD